MITNKNITKDLNMTGISTKEILNSIQYSESFFQEELMKKDSLLLPNVQPVKSIITSDKDGLITVINLSSKVDDKLQGLLNSQKKYLMDLTGLATAFVAKKAEKNPEKKRDIKLWEEVFSHLPLMGPCKFRKENYSKKVYGVEIAKTFIDFIVNSVVQKTAALNELEQFLKNQGESIKFGVENNKDGFQMGCICIILEAIPVGKETQIIPKIKGYFAKFTRRNYNFTFACFKHEEINIDFEYQTAVSAFNYQALEEKSVKNKFNAFIANAQVENLEDSKNYFEAPGVLS